MSHPDDASAKYLVQTRLADWLPLSGRTTAAVEIVDADLSTVTAAADRVLYVHEHPPWLFHIEWRLRKIEQGVQGMNDSDTCQAFSKQARFQQFRLLRSHRPSFPRRRKPRLRIAAICFRRSANQPTHQQHTLPRSKPT